MAEAAASRLSRLLAMVPWLQQHPGVSIAEAALHFGVSSADFERDLWLTICCGLPGHGPDQLIDIQFWDDDGAIHVIDPQTLDRPLRLSPSEAMSLLVGLRLLAQAPGDHAALASATAKLEAAADVGHGAAIVVDDGDADIADLLSRAISTQRAVHLVYAGASRDEVTDRIVEPLQLLHHAGRTYLAGWCREAGAARTFRLDRILSAEVVESSISPREATVDVAPSGGERVRVRVSPASRWLLEGWETAHGTVQPDGSLEATLTVADRDWLVRIVLGQGGGLEVLEPDDLRRQVLASAQAALS